MSQDDIPEVEVKERRGPSLIWIIPLVAVLVGALLVYRTLSEKGPTVTIRFETADWLETGKTKIKFRSLQMGEVTDIEIGKDLGSVVVHAELKKGVAPHLREGAQFWVVKPRVGAGGVSGLGAIMSGAWINFDPPAGTGGKPVRDFVGLEEPPPPSDDQPGLRLVVHADALLSLDSGSPVYYREIQVGSVYANKLSKDGRKVDLNLFIEPEFAEFVRVDSRFWSVGGISVSGSITDLDVQMESLDALIRGGIAFDAPRGERSKAAEGGREFWLHRSKADVKESSLRYGGLRLILESDALGSLSAGDLVYYREIPVGAVVSHEMSRDSRTVRVRLNVQNRYAKLVRSNSVFWNASGISAHLGLHGLEIETESLQALLAGGVAFATPDRPGARVKEGSVFRLHSEHEDAWLEWSPLIWRGPPGTEPKGAAAAKDKEGPIARFFHHGGSTEEQAGGHGEHQPDASQGRADEKHGFFHRLFGGGD
ncbi:MAG: MCE family protein [Deltaproteobacteria bacterium]|nr:MCE family protein [Deltaproteobacteria bacterium]